MKTFKQFIKEEKLAPTHICISDKHTPTIKISGVWTKLVGFLANIKKNSECEYKFNILDKDCSIMTSLSVNSFKFSHLIDDFRELTPVEKTSMKYGI